MVSLYPYFSSLLRVVRHFQFLGLAAKYRVSHGFQTIQFLHNLFACSVLHTHPAFRFTRKILFFIGAFACCIIIQGKAGGLIWRFSLAVRDA